jgi:predicted nucleic acid-binding protein
MPVVVDASAIAAVAFGEPNGRTIAGELAGASLVAPALIDYELANIALKKARKRREEAPVILIALQAALRLPISRVAIPGGEVFALAARTGLSAYDASYLWVARDRDLQLITLDEALARASSGA